MTREEYEKNVIRMFDSIRSDHKGEKACRGVNCRDCPYNEKFCNTGEKGFRVYEAIEIVENWANEHPIVTNADKFREVFGVEYEPMNACITDADCRDCQYCDDDGMCEVNKRFWNKEYNEKTKE